MTKTKRIKVNIMTFGCTMNQAHSEMLAGMLVKKGFELVDDENRADVVIVNSCAVKLPTENKILARVQKLVQKKRVIVTGCLAELVPERIIKLGASVVSVHHFDKIPEVISRVLKGELIDIHGFRYIERVNLPRVIENPLIIPVPIGFGCDGECAFCADRLIWGKYKSYSLEKIVEDVRRFVKKGAKEIRLTAHDTACYGWDRGYTLADLLEKLVEIEGDFRIRVGMMSPNAFMKVYEDVLEVIKSTDKIYHFFHLPVQSGSNQVLKLMKRKHSVEDLIYLVNVIRKYFPDTMLVTDIIVGFPGETDEDFELTKKLLLEVKPDRVHISKYGDRPGTLAAKMKPKVRSQIVKKRSYELTCLAQRIAFEINQKYIGKNVNVLMLESYPDKKGYLGRMQNYKRVLVFEEVKLGEWISAQVKKVTWRYLIGKVL